MLAGRRFILKIPTIAVDSRRVAVMMPIGAVLDVLSESVDGKMTQAIWDGRPVAMFTIDLEERGREIAETVNAANGQGPLDPERVRKVLQNELEAAHGADALDRWRFYGKQNPTGNAEQLGRDPRDNVVR